MDDRSFRTAIWHESNDDNLRLVYADWLEEQGDAARADLIRIQCELANTPPKEERFVALKKQEWQLILKHRDHWLKEMPKLNNVSWGILNYGGSFISRKAERVYFTCGLMESATISTWKALETHAVVLFTSHPITRLAARTISTNRIEKNHQYLCNLNALTLSNSYCYDRATHLAATPTLSNLRELTIGNGLIGDATVRAIAESEYLRNLQILRCSGNQITSAGAAAIAESPNFNAIRQLDLSRGLIGDEGVEALASSANFANLHCLRLNGQMALGHPQVIGDRGASAIAKSAHLGNLVSLDLRDNAIGIEGAAELVRSPTVSHLRQLNLDSNQIGPEIIAAIGSSEYLKGLTHLRLANCEVGDDEARTLISSDNFSNLVFLDLSGNRISSAGVQTLAEWPNLSRLEFLGLANNLFDEQGRKTLQQSRLSKTADVWLWNTPGIEQLTEIG